MHIIYLYNKLKDKRNKINMVKWVLAVLTVSFIGASGALHIYQV